MKYVPVTFSVSGKFNNTESFLRRALNIDFASRLATYGPEICDALSKNTPIDTGKTADSWSYGIERSKNRISLCLYNSNENNGVNIAIVLEYGHATVNGLYVKGYDYINPSVQPYFDKIVNTIWNDIIK